MHRRSLDIESFSHENPIPTGTRIGPLLVSSIVAPFDPGTRKTPAEGIDQVRNLFTHMGNILAEGGATWDDVAKITFFVTDIKLRGVINGPWAEHFPDPASRPSRHTLVVPGEGVRVTSELLAYVGD